MLPYSLRGQPAKKKFVEQYAVRGIWHSIFLPGERGQCCCGDTLEGEFFQFHYEKDTKSGTFYAGPGCGKSLFEELADKGVNILVPPLFDPFGLRPQSQVNASHADNYSGGTVTPSVPSNREMVAAISLLLHFWKKKEGFLLDVKNILLNEPQREPTDRELIALNKAVRKTCEWRHGITTLRQMFEDECNKKSIHGKTFRFPYLEKRLQQLNEEVCL